MLDPDEPNISFDEAEKRRRALSSQRAHDLLGNIGVARDFVDTVAGPILDNIRLQQALGADQQELAALSGARQILGLLKGLAPRNNPQEWEDQVTSVLEVTDEPDLQHSTYDIDKARFMQLVKKRLIVPNGQTAASDPNKIFYPRGFMTRPPIILNPDSAIFTLDTAFDLPIYHSWDSLTTLLNKAFHIPMQEIVAMLGEVVPPDIGDAHYRNVLAISAANACLWLLLSTRFRRIMYLFALSVRLSDMAIMNIYNTEETFDALHPAHQTAIGRSRSLFQLIDTYPTIEGRQGLVTPETSIQDTIFDMQSIPMLAYVIQVMYTMFDLSCQPDAPSLKLYFSLRVHTRRYKVVDGELQVTFAEAKCPNIDYGSDSDHLVYKPGMSSVELINNIHDAMLQIYYGRSRGTPNNHDSDFLPLQSRRFRHAAGGDHICDIAVSGITFNCRPDGVFAPISMRDGLADGIANLVVTLKNLQAYAISPSILKKWRHISHNFENRYENFCVLEAFCFIRCRQMRITNHNDIFDKIYKKYQNHSASAAVDLFATLEFCISRVDPEFFFGGEFFQSIDLVFFDAFGKSPKLPNLTISQFYGEDEEPITKVDIAPNHVFSLFERTDDIDCLLYHQGHVFPANFGMYRKAIETTSTTALAAIQHSVASGEHIQHVMKRIDWCDRRYKGGQAEFDHLVQRNCIRDSDKILCFSPGKKIHKLSADFETGHCSQCSAKYGYDAQDAFCASIAWGTKVQESISFMGHECEHKAKLSGFDTYDGCVTALLRWCRNNLGFSCKQLDTADFPDGTIRRFIYFYNGANFDIHFIHRVLLGWNETIEMIPMDGAIVSLTWGNITFLDFYRLFPAGTLDNCFESFKQFDVPEKAICPPSGKWKCFPYGLITDSSYDNPVSISDMADPEIWGGKIIDGDVNNNVSWWQQNICPDGYRPHQHLIDYCNSDVLLLQYMVIVESRHIAIGSYKDSKGEERFYDTNDCLTASSAAMHMFQQAFLEETIVTPFLDETIDIVDPITHTPLSLQRVWDMSYAGGKVDLFRHDISTSVEEQELWDKVPGGHVIDEYDFNSMYPACMLGEIPTHYDGFAKLDGEVMNEPVQDTNLYWCSIQYPPKKSGILTRCMSRCVALNYLSETFVDPKRPHMTQYTFVWGVEINEAFHQGCVIQLYGVVYMTTSPIYHRYVETIYQERLDTNDPLVKNVKKLRLNGLYGKKAQARRANMRIVYNCIDLVQTNPLDEIVSLKHIPGNYTGKTLIAAEVLDHSKPWVGQWKFIASFITSKARATLCKAVHYVQSCRNMIGKPCRVYYTDTDSIKCDIPEPNSPFYHDWVHQSELGKLKSETKNIGYDDAIFCRKKTNMCHKKVDMPIFCHQEYVIKCKGVPKSVVSPEDMRAIYEKRESKKFVMPMSFKRHFDKGIEKTNGLTRSVGIGNSTRQPPNEEGDLLPFDNVDRFVEAIEAEI